MPTIAIERKGLFELLGQTYTEKEFDELCFDFGLELDEVTSEAQMISKEQGDEFSEGASDEVIYKIEVPANRYDLLCAEGLARALLIFLGRIPIPEYRAVAQSTTERLVVTRATGQIRPYCVAAILRNVTLGKDRYKRFIDLQDKLHQNLCRQRSLVAIGTHDYDKIRGPFLYDARAPADIRFRPLNQTREYRADELMQLYSHDSHLKPYLGIIRDSPVYPIIYDADGVVLSMPPIINGDRSKITPETRNIFIESTATDLTKARIVLDTLCCMFSQYCANEFVTERVDVQHESDGSVVSYPTLAYRTESVDVLDSCRQIGVEMKAQEVIICRILFLRTHCVLNILAEHAEKEVKLVEKFVVI